MALVMIIVVRNVIPLSCAGKDSSANMNYCNVHGLNGNHGIGDVGGGSYGHGGDKKMVLTVTLLMTMVTTVMVSIMVLLAIVVDGVDGQGERHTLQSHCLVLFYQPKSFSVVSSPA